MTRRRKKLFLKALVECKLRTGSLVAFLAHLSKQVYWYPPDQRGGRGHSRSVVPPHSCFLITGAPKTGKTYLGHRIREFFPQAKVLETLIARSALGEEGYVNTDYVLADHHVEGCDMVIVLVKRRDRIGARILKNRFHQCDPSREFWISPVREP